MDIPPPPPPYDISYALTIVVTNCEEKPVNNGLLYKASVCDSSRLNTTKTVQSKQLDKNNKLRFGESKNVSPA